MRLTDETANWLVDRMASRLNGGTLAIYSGIMPDVAGEDVQPQNPLVTFTFQPEAFEPAVLTVAMANPIASATAQLTGDAGWARLATLGGLPLADVPVKAADAPDVEIGDVVVDRTDFHRGGRCDVGRVTLTIPLQCSQP